MILKYVRRRRGGGGGGGGDGGGGEGEARRRRRRRRGGARARRGLVMRLMMAFLLGLLFEDILGYFWAEARFFGRDSYKNSSPQGRSGAVLTVRFWGRGYRGGGLL